MRAHLVPLLRRANATTRQATEWFLTETAQAALRYTLGSASILIGLSWIFGPAARHTSAIYQVWNELGISWELTGIWALISGVLIVVPLRWPWVRALGYGMGFLFRFTFAGYALAAFFDNNQTGITGFTDWGTLAVAHVVCLWAVLKARDTPGLEDVKAAISRRADV